MTTLAATRMILSNDGDAKPATPVVEARFVGGNLGYQWGILVDGIVKKRGLCLAEVPAARSDAIASLVVKT